MNWIGIAGMIVLTAGPLLAGCADEVCACPPALANLHATVSGTVFTPDSVPVIALVVPQAGPGSCTASHPSVDAFEAESESTGHYAVGVYVYEDFDDLCLRVRATPVRDSPWAASDWVYVDVPDGVREIQPTVDLYMKHAE